MGDIPHIISGGKINHHSIREAQEKKALERRRNILHLIHSFLKENYFTNAAESLEREAHLSPNLEVCDNVDLDTILQEYTSYYFSKFGKYPKICKKTTSQIDIPEKKKQTRSASRPKIQTVQEEPSKDHGDSFEISVKQLIKDSSSDLTTIYSNPEEEGLVLPEPLSGINLHDYPAEWKEMIQVISREIIPKNLGIKWEDCIGMEQVIILLQEAIVFPLEFPQFFGHITPWQGILLYGPPGGGKTLVAKALACESSKMVINVSPSTFVSKWRGESEKLVRCLFEIAKKCSPCTVFIDEIDALASKREEVQHEASRRFKSELLTQMDGILNNDKKIFILATTNLPWEVDSAILRRFDKKIFVDLPNTEARIQMFHKFLNLEKFKPNISNVDLQSFADKTENFSGSEIKLICKNASMSVVRRYIQKVQIPCFKQVTFDTRCIPTISDVHEAIVNARSSSASLRQKYIEWQDKYGGI